MAIRYWVRVILTVIVYSAGISLGSYIFVSSTTNVLIAIPTGIGLLLLIHATRMAHLDELGYSIMVMWAAILAISAVSAILNEYTQMINGNLPAAIGIFSITGVLIVSYLLAVVYFS